MNTSQAKVPLKNRAPILLIPLGIFFFWLSAPFAQAQGIPTFRKPFSTEPKMPSQLEQLNHPKAFSVTFPRRTTETVISGEILHVPDEILMAIAVNPPDVKAMTANAEWKPLHPFTIDPIAREDTIKPKVTVTGTIDKSGHAVWVNGVRADVTGNGWEAHGVPLPRGSGRALIEAQPIPLSANAGYDYGAPRKPTTADLGNPRATRPID